MVEKQNHTGRREAWKVWGLVAVLFGVGLALTWPFVGDPPPARIRLATGSAGGEYAAAGKKFAQVLKRAGIDVDLVASAGSGENLQALRRGEVDVAFVQSGLCRVEDRKKIQGVASLYFEPVWLFVSGKVAPDRLTGLQGKRLEIGAPGSGTRSVASALLQANGLVAAQEDWRGNAPAAAVDALLSGEVDGLVLITRPGSPLVRRLFDAAEEGRVVPMPLQRAFAYSRHFRYLSSRTLTTGMFDLQRDLPRQPVPMVAATATLLMRTGLHESVVPLLIEAARDRFADGDLLADEGEFPSARNIGVPVSDAARRFYEHGQSFLYRWLPFQVAAALDRLKILIVPLLTLLIPLVRLAPPLYRWRVRSRIYRWYQSLSGIEARIAAAGDGAERQRIATDLDALDAEVRDVTVPLSYAEELYNLRMHVRLVRRDLPSQPTNAGTS